MRLSVEVPEVVCDDCYKRVIKEFTKQAKVTGSFKLFLCCLELYFIYLFVFKL